jgi:hypothetical protein
MIRWRMNNELKRIWKEVAAPNLRYYLLGGTEENHKERQLERPVSGLRF